MPWKRRPSAFSALLARAKAKLFPARPARPQTPPVDDPAYKAALDQLAVTKAAMMQMDALKSDPVIAALDAMIERAKKQKKKWKHFEAQKRDRVTEILKQAKAEADAKADSGERSPPTA